MRGILVVLICAGFAQAQDVQWVYFESAETGKGAVLKLEMLDGSKKELAVTSDTVMLQYIERFIGASHTRLSVDLADKNRTLLRFETPNVDRVQKAELVLQMRLSQTPPHGAFSIAVYNVTTEWHERWVRWPLQPDYDTQPRETVRLQPREQVVRIPMTDIVNAWTSKQTPNLGLMLRVAKPFPAGEQRGVQPNAAEKRGAPQRGKRVKNDAQDWISIASREAGNGPRLLLEIDGVGQREIPASADTGVISYLADRKWGRLGFLAISLNDSNRMLLRFDMPPKLGKVKKATLRLDTKPSPMNPPQKFDVALHPLTKAWKEMDTDWLTQPKMAKKAVATFVVRPSTRARTLSFDVTELVNSKTGLEHGWLLKVAKPMDKAEVKKDARVQRAAQQILLQKHDLKWLASVDAALKEAKAKNRMVLALVDGTHDINKPSFGAKLLMATALVDPDIRTLIEKRFVPVRIAYRAQAYTAGIFQSPELRKLGTKVLDAKAPALVVSDATGKHIATLASFGTYDKHQVLHFLAKTLPLTAGGGDPYELLAAGDWVNAMRGLARLETGKARRARARLLSFTGKHGVAVDMLGLLDDAKARAQMGVAQTRLGWFEIALKTLTGTEVPEGRYYLGCLLHRKGSFAEARAQWEAIPASSK